MLAEAGGALADPGVPARHEKASAQLQVMVDVVVGRQSTGGAARRDDLANGAIDDCSDLGMIRLTGETHRLGKVGWRDEKDVDMVNGENLGEVLDRLHLFDQNHD